MTKRTSGEGAKFVEGFDYSALTRSQRERIDRVRTGVKQVVETLYQVLPSGEQKDAAIRKLSEAMMAAISAIVLGPDPDLETGG